MKLLPPITPQGSTNQIRCNYESSTTQRCGASVDLEQLSSNQPVYYHPPGRAKMNGSQAAPPDSLMELVWSVAQASVFFIGCWQPARSPLRSAVWFCKQGLQMWCQLLQEWLLCSIIAFATTDYITLLLYPTCLHRARHGQVHMKIPPHLHQCLGSDAPADTIVGQKDSVLSNSPKTHLLDVSQDGWLLGCLPSSEKNLTSATGLCLFLCSPQDTHRRALCCAFFSVTFNLFCNHLEPML